MIMSYLMPRQSATDHVTREREIRLLWNVLDA